jgi:hypothetical protein
MFNVPAEATEAFLAQVDDADQLVKRLVMDRGFWGLIALTEERTERASVISCKRCEAFIVTDRTQPAAYAELILWMDRHATRCTKTAAA